MPPKNDLSAFKKQIPAKASILANKQTERRGRKPKPEAEKESEIVALKLTKGEKEKLAQNAGLVPLGTYLKDFLRNKTDVFS